jgi:hypothetical protein
MRASAHKPNLHRSLSWLFWLALLLPVAQAAATWHGYSHGQAETSGRDQGKQAPHTAQCDLCLVWQALPTLAYLSRAPPAAPR